MRGRGACDVVDGRFEDFTEAEYRELVTLACRRWEFVGFVEGERSGRVCLWRHDIDFSVRRAHALSCIEADAGVVVTYFVHLHSHFYNPLEAETARALRGVKAHGHHVGLHIDPAFHWHRVGMEDRDALEKLVRSERELLQDLLGAEVLVASVHIPDSSMPSWIWEEHLCGMLNASSARFRDGYAYCSDSNGHWRFDRLRDVLERGSDARLHVLTHPGWWVPSSMSPRQRIQRCIDGRADDAAAWYDDALSRLGRANAS